MISHNLFFFDEPISRVKHHKHIGIVIQQNLKWVTHIYTKINILNHLSRNVNRKTLEILYKSFIRPVLLECLFYHDIINGNAPQYLIDDLPGHVRDRTRYNLRNRDDSNLYNCKRETFKSSFFPSTTKFWNNLDESIRSIESKSGLKAKLLKVIAPVHPYYYSGRRKINITLAKIRMHCGELHQHLAGSGQ